MRIGVRLLSILLVASLLAGCAKGPPKETTPTETEPPPLVPPNADYGGVEGYVFGPDLAPIANVTVAFQKTNLSAKTDVTGYYAVLPVQPGEYRMEVNLTSYQPAVRALTVGAGQSLRIDFTLQEIPNPDPYVDDSFTRRGQIQCTGRANAAGQNSNPSCSDVAKQATGPYLPPSQGANITVGGGIEGLLIEVQWTASTPAVNEKLRLAIRVSEADTWRQYEGASVLRVELGPTQLGEMSEFAGRNYTKDGGQIFFNLYPGEAANNGGSGAGATFQQDYTMYVTIFYRQPPIPGFTRVPA